MKANYCELCKARYTTCIETVVAKLTLRAHYSASLELLALAGVPLLRLARDKPLEPLSLPLPTPDGSSYLLRANTMTEKDMNLLLPEMLRTRIVEDVCTAGLQNHQAVREFTIIACLVQ